MRVLLDTNILFSALAFPGAPGRLLERLVAAEATVMTTDYVLQELRQIIREKFKPRQFRRAFGLLSAIITSGKVQVITVGSYGHNLYEAEELINREDAPILAAAMLPQVDHFVTGDNHFLDNPAVKQRLGVKMLRVADMLKKLG